MQNAQSIRAGRAFVELFADDRQLVRGLRRAEKKLRAFGGSIRNLGLTLAGAVSAAVAPLGVLSIGAAADAQESLSRFEQVFKDQAQAAAAFADAVARSVGRSKFAIRDALATFQSFFVGLGFDRSRARELSQTLQTLALDFASFNNLSDDEAIQRFIAALSGSGEVLDRFGINIKQAALQQELLRLGVRKSSAQVTEQEKALARLQIIMRSMGDQGAVGDAVRTAGSFTNQMKRLRGQVRDTAVAIGQALLPIVTPMVAKAAEAAKWFGAWISRNQQLVATVFKVAAGVAVVGGALIVLGVAVSGLGATLGVLATTLAGVSAAFGVLASAIGLLASPVGLVITAVGVLGAKVVASSGAAGGAVNWLADRFRGLRDAASASFRGIAEALARGDVPAAAQVLWASLQLIWVQGMAALDRLWLGFMDTFLRAGQDAFAGLVAASEIGLNALEVGWIEATAAVSRAWSGFTAFFARSWVRMQAIARKAWLQIRALFDGSVRRSAQATRAEIDRQRDAALGRIDQQQARANDRRERQRAAERQAAARLSEATLAAIGRDNLRRHRELDTAYEQRIAQTQAELDRAQAAWQEAIDQVGKAPAPGINSGTVPTIDRGLLQSAQDAIDQLDDTLAQQTARITTRGTFLAANVLGLQGATSGGADSAARIAAGIDRIERNTRALRHADALSFT